GLTREVLVEMTEALTDAKNDDDILVVVITAGGEGFHMGAMAFGDARADWKFTPLEFREVTQAGHDLFRMIELLEKPVVGVAKAGAVGGGLENLHACDFVIVADNAQLSQPEVTLGMICGWGGTQRLTRMVGWRKAKELLIGGIAVSGTEAERIGLVTTSVPSDQVDGVVEALCEQLKTNGPVAMAYTKLAMNKVWETDYRSGLDFEVEAASMVNSAGEFTAEVFEDFLEGRKPTFDKRQRITSDPAWRPPSS
ncbi:MAG: enoyl-CoA hydratase/isomerase family protein, partial [Acidimicrobiales bacterium]